MTVHPTAIIEKGAELHASVKVGPYAILGPKVKVAEGVSIGAHAVIEGDTRIGRGCRIFHHASVGAVPQDLKFHGEDTRLDIGEENIIREFATLHIGTEGGGGVTRVGNKNLFMAYSHVAHDCVVGHGCVLANGATLAGHVEIGDHAILGGLSAVHQFTRLGEHSFIAGGAMVAMDVPPYCTAQGDRAELAGLNTVGLTRHGFKEDQLGRIKEAYRILFRSKMGLNEALARLKAEYGGHVEIDRLLAFIASSKRGITR